MSVSIKLRRNLILIEGYTLGKGTPGWLPNHLRVYDPKTKRYDKEKTYSYQLSDGTIIMPRTTDLNIIINKLRSQGCEIEGITEEPNEGVISFRNLSKEFQFREGIRPKDDTQIASIDFLSEMLGKNMHYRLLSIPTGGGKTFCAIAAIMNWNRKTLIVANKLVHQWVDELLLKTNISYRKIFEIEGISSIRDTLLDRNVKPDTYDIFVGTLQTLINACEQGYYQKFVEKFGIGLKIVDEVHLATYSHVWLDMQVPIQETLYLSATPARSDNSEDFVLRRAFFNLPQFGREVKVFAQKYLNVIWVFFNTHPLYYETKKCNSFYGFNVMEYAKHLMDPSHVGVLRDILKWALDTTLGSIGEHEKIAIIFELKSQIREMKAWIQHLYPDIPVGDYSSNVDHNVKIDSLKNTIILTTESSFGTGSDLKDSLRVLINTTTFNSKVTAEQMPGRLRNIPGRKVYYIDLVNEGFKRTYSHYQNRSKVINKYAASVQYRNFGK